MAASDRRIVTAKKIEELPRDTWPVPAMSDADDTSPESAIVSSGGPDGSHDTIPTPPPSSGVVVDVRVPALQPLDLDDVEPDTDRGPSND